MVDMAPTTPTTPQPLCAEIDHDDEPTDRGGTSAAWLPPSAAVAVRSEVIQLITRSPLIAGTGTHKSPTRADRPTKGLQRVAAESSSCTAGALVVPATWS
jgi:hypothetical protein